jgi:hypothetical protein
LGDGGGTIQPQPHAQFDVLSTLPGGEPVNLELIYKQIPFNQLSAQLIVQKIVSLCARVDSDPAFYPQLAYQANRLSDWAALPAQANAHGLGPLLYVHLKEAGVSIPQPVKRELQGLYLRHRHANQVRGRVLAELLTAFEAADIPALVLKGAALAHLLYPEPGLRPMRDIDLLVSRAEARRAQQLLAELGFKAPVPAPEAPLPGKHLSNATRTVEGLTVSVELHHNLFNVGTPASLELADLPPRSLQAFPVAGVTALERRLCRPASSALPGPPWPSNTRVTARPKLWPSSIATSLPGAGMRPRLFTAWFLPRGQKK